jgi:hypothetical protein
MTTLGEAAIAIALSYEGVHETEGHDRGPEIDMFLRSQGLPPGNPWCASFVCFCIMHAAKALKIQPKFQYGGSVYKLWTRNPELRIAKPDYNCVFLLDHGLSQGGSRIGHTGFVIGPGEIPGTLETMEGNTNAAGSRTGGKAMHRSRKMEEFTKGYGFLLIG